MALPRISFGGKDYNPPKAVKKKFKPTGWSPVLNNPDGSIKLNPIGADGRPVSTAPAPPPKTPAAQAPYTAPGPDESWKDQTYFDTTSGISKGLDNLKGYLVNSGKGLSADYGIDYTGDPVNGASGFNIADNVDVTNPFSRAALLKKSYQQATAGNTNSMAARGQLYSGALQNAQNETGRQNLQAQDSLIKDFSGRFGGLYQQWLDGQGAATTQGVDAQVAATGRHQNDPVIAPAPPPVAGSSKPQPGWQNIAYKDVAAAGLQISAQGGKFVVRDSKGNVIPGATIVVQGKNRFVRVPR
jgi:hypothetical protein